MSVFGVPAPAAARRRRASAFGAYCVVQGCLLSAALAAPYPATAAVCLTVAALGTTIFVIGVACGRPWPRIGWLLIAVGAVSTTAVGAAVAATNGLRESVVVSSPLPVGLGAVTLPALAAGLAILGRAAGGRAETADRIDAAMMAAGSVLLAWLFVTEPIGLTTRASHIAGAVLVPLGALLVFLATAKIVISGGVRQPAVGFVVLAAAVLLAAVVAMMFPAVHTAMLTADRTVHVLWAAHGGLLGAAALHPSFGRPVLGSGVAPMEASLGRLLLFAGLAVLVPIVIAIDLVDRPTAFDRTATGVAVPTAAAAGLLLLLVGRLAMIARMSQQRERELSQRSALLSASMAEQQALQRQLADQAVHDALTGLSNRVVLAERLEWALSQPSKGTGHVLLLLDLDGFKDINDTFGHLTGDQVLVAASHRLLMTAPDDSVVARLGGDEFAVLLENTGEAKANASAERLLEAVRRPFDIGGQEVHLSTSIGLFSTDLQPGAISRLDVLRNTDLALYAAKRAGKNRLVVFEPQLRTEHLERAGIGAGLRRALSCGELRVHYQPVVNLATGSTVAVEALARWRPPDGEFIPPRVFIPIAEETGLINAVGTRILDRACHDADLWYREREVSVSVNVSGRQRDDPQFAEMVTNALANAGLPGTALILELTESSLVATTPDQPEFGQLEQLRSHGVRVAVDDFGTGYSSLASVARMPVDIVKLDKSFIQPGSGRGSDEPNWTFIGAILRAIASLGLDAVAEGVETAEQADTLRSLRCSYAQGFLFARPAPTATIDRALGVSRRADETPEW